MKRFAYLAIPLLMVGCGGQRVESPDTSMDADFDPTESHPFAERVETTSDIRLSAIDLTWHGDTIGTLIIEQTEADTSLFQLRSFIFRDVEGGKGTVICQYNDFNELLDLWITAPDTRNHSMLQWDDEGNLVSVNQELWIVDSLSVSPKSHKIRVFEYRYNQHSAYGNWYAGMAEQIGGPIAELIHAGFLGRAPWTLPEEVIVICSEIQDNMVGEQHTYRSKIQYTFDNNERVINERGCLYPDSRAYSYDYSYN